MAGLLLHWSQVLNPGSGKHWARVHHGGVSQPLAVNLIADQVLLLPALLRELQQ